MRNRQLHDALRDFAEEAAWQLASDASDGHELEFEVVESGSGRRRDVPLYCYRPLTADFIDRRHSILQRLPSYLPAVHALAASSGLAGYLEAHVARGGVPRAPRERAELALRAFLSRVFCDSTEFVLAPERFAAAYDELEAVVTEGRTETVVVAPVLGLALQATEVPMGEGLSLVRGEILEDAPRDAVHLGDGPSVLAVLRWEAEAGDPAPLLRAEVRLRRLLTALRLFDDAPVAIGPAAWTRAAGGPWRVLGLGLEGAAPGPDAPPCLVAEAEEDELRAFCSLVGRRLPRSGELAWALRRFELACTRPTPADALTDHLLALRALLEPEGPASGRLPGRIAALCADAADRATLAARLTETVALERRVVSGVGLPDADHVGHLVEELAADARAILRDVLCGHLDPDLCATADGLLAQDPDFELA